VARLGAVHGEAAISGRVPRLLHQDERCR
jgi:hypothetical protein